MNDKTFIFFTGYGVGDLNRELSKFIHSYSCPFPEDSIYVLNDRTVIIQGNIIVKFVSPYNTNNCLGCKEYGTFYISMWLKHASDDKSCWYIDNIRREMYMRKIDEDVSYTSFLKSIHAAVTTTVPALNNRTTANDRLEIKDVIFNGPATIVFWKDGTKTVVKCQDGDLFNPETGIAMAIVKKTFGNKSNFNNIFKPWVEKFYNETEEECEVSKALTHLMDRYFKLFDIKTDAQEGENNND